jgi:hypothetical protein
MSPPIRHFSAHRDGAAGGEGGSMRRCLRCHQETRVFERACLYVHRVLWYEGITYYAVGSRTAAIVMASSR